MGRGRNPPKKWHISVLTPPPICRHISCVSRSYCKSFEQLIFLHPYIPGTSKDGNIRLGLLCLFRLIFFLSSQNLFEATLNAVLEIWPLCARNIETMQFEKIRPNSGKPSLNTGKTWPNCFAYALENQETMRTIFEPPLLHHGNIYLTGSEVIPEGPT